MKSKKLKARVGIYTAGLKVYWDQFEGLRERLIEYGKHIGLMIEDYAEVYNYGMVDDEYSGRAAGEWFNEKNVDLIFCHSGTYFTSSSVLPIHQINSAPVIILNLQPTPQMNYGVTTTGEWLAHCGACPVPELTNALHRAGIPYRTVNGLLGLNETPEISMTDEVTYMRDEAKLAKHKIVEWVKAASVKRTLQHSRFGFLGNNYSGMLDMYSDFAMIQAQTGCHVEILEMCDLDESFVKVTDEDIDAKLKEIHEFFTISGDSPSEPLAKKPTDEQLNWSARVAVAQQKMVDQYDLDAIAYYYHGKNDNHYEQVQSGFIVGHSLLTSKGVPCSGEGDLKTALSMKICDVLGVGGSFCEIVATDYIYQTIILGHDGPFHINISDGKPVLRGMGVYHGKRGQGVSVEANVIRGPVTMLGTTQTKEGSLKFIISEGEAIKKPILTIGNTQTHIKFSVDPDSYMDKWFNEAPTHHLAMSVGHNAELFKKVACMLNIEYVVI
ncbi:L-arabinose isomerase [Vallitalea longa]|uniref:L-arabinose isomerase n=1 Tax=Vallitalea longa TaxID=2936439 RepID=A0A9W5Y827_9FIRM|nr:L-fucose/L-arabinose isomerase family protein [Vallitalea longa]GKX27681.1 L-arabinose isomerase [Vallitalea longa]